MIRSAVGNLLLLAATTLVLVPPAAKASDEEAVRAPLVERVSPKCQISVQNRSDFGGACWSLACDSKKTRKLGCELAAMSTVGVVSASPDRRWLAVISAGEGHPFLEIVDLGRLVRDRGYRALLTINPYPGTINLVRWSSDALIVESDMPLTEMPIPLEEAESRMIDPPGTFRIRIGTWKVESSAPQPHRR
jgi:hypothetical protein